MMKSLYLPRIPPVDVAADDFAGTNGSNLTTRVTSTGGYTWTANAGALTFNASGRVQNTGGSGNYTINAGFVDAFVSADLTIGSGTTNQHAGILIRCADVNNYYSAKLVLSNGGPSATLFLAKRLTGTLSTLKQIAVTYSAGATITLKSYGTYISASYQGVTIAAIDSGLTTQTKTGLRWGEGSAMTAGDYQVDNFVSQKILGH